MMFASDAEFVCDFIERTKKNYDMVEKGPYEVTQLINSSVGLLFIPRDSGFVNISDDMISKELWTKLTSCISKNTYGQTLTLEQLVRHLRNGIAHGRFEFKAEKPPMKNQQLIIQSIKITDCDPKNTTAQFEITLTIEFLEEFFLSFSDAVCKSIKTQPRKGAKK